ncbi:uncharacterized protein LY79DRAFT_150094 [Colletotrichum navitas]|uniref:Uncharacterized protein n=1 Tax=Colletotrichum navitas TaxID=681940 RepID=A0AAD8VC64_9PEZI|nr:uncharacterized protein LY79DRAFT_150094 [Colletotrichum navitas]KAK1599736.1 hypothetical protein LY79DRAFT_150094 [Colletotrichum navitas]
MGVRERKGKEERKKKRKGRERAENSVISSREGRGGGVQMARGYSNGQHSTLESKSKLNGVDQRFRERGRERARSWSFGVELEGEEGEEDDSRCGGRGGVEEWNDEQVHSPHVKSPHDMCPPLVSSFLLLQSPARPAFRRSTRLWSPPPTRLQECSETASHRSSRAHLSLSPTVPVHSVASRAQPIPAIHPTDVNGSSSALSLSFSLSPSLPLSPGNAARMTFGSKSKSGGHIWKAPPPSLPPPSLITAVVKRVQGGQITRPQGGRREMN